MNLTHIQYDICCTCTNYLSISDNEKNIVSPYAIKADLLD